MECEETYRKIEIQESRKECERNEDDDDDDAIHIVRNRERNYNFFVVVATAVYMLAIVHYGNGVKIIREWCGW